MKLLGYFRELPTGSDGKLFSQVKGNDIGDTMVPLYTRDLPAEGAWERRVVAAANKYGDVIVVADRHHSRFMNSQLKILKEAGVIKSTHTREQGFIDNQGNFLTREEACVVAREAGQINQVRLKTNPFHELFSEDLY